MPNSENKKRYNAEYEKEHLKRIPLNVQKEFYDGIKKAADSSGLPVNTYIKQAIREKMERDSSPNS